VRISSLLCSGAFALCAGSAAAEVVTLDGEVGSDTSAYHFVPSTPRGNNETLWAFSDPDEMHDFETFLRFDLPPEWLCSNVGVSQALLYFVYVLDSTPQGQGTDEPGTLECREVLEAWSEGTLTWTNKPDYGPPIDLFVDYLGSSEITELGALACDVTDLVADWVDCAAPNYGFAVTNPTGRLMGSYSFEAPVDPVFQPALVVYLPEPGVGGAYVAVAGLGVLARWRGRRRRRRAARGGRA